MKWMLLVRTVHVDQYWYRYRYQWINLALYLYKISGKSGIGPI